MRNLTKVCFISSIVSLQALLYQPSIKFFHTMTSSTKKSLTDNQLILIKNPQVNSCLQCKLANFTGHIEVE